MHNHFDCRHGDPHPSLPMISGPRWFDDDDAPFRLQIQLPLTFEEMVAALYNVVELADIASDEDLRGSVAVTVLIDGLTALMARVSKIRQDEQRHTIESPSSGPTAASRGRSSRPMTLSRTVTSPRFRRQQLQPCRPARSSEYCYAGDSGDPVGITPSERLSSDRVPQFKVVFVETKSASHHQCISLLA